MSESFSVLSFNLCHATEPATFNAYVYLLYTVLHLWPYVQLMYCTLGYTLSLVAVIYAEQRAMAGRSWGRRDCFVHLSLLSSICYDGKSQRHDANAPPPPPSPPWFVLFHSLSLSLNGLRIVYLLLTHRYYKFLILLGFIHSCPCAADDCWLDSLLCERFSPVSLFKEIMT